MRQHHKTIILSDIHLGTKGSRARELSKFLKENTADKLILNGDIIDGWQLKKSGKWKKHHTRFLRRVLQMIENHKTEVIYTRGNHDDFLDQILPFRMGKISIQRDYIHRSHGKSYYVVHGDIFDTVTTKLKWIAKLGDIGYTFLLWLNQQYNAYRRSKGMPYYSLSKAVKARVKSAVSYISKFEYQLTELARIKKCDGIICGHIHQPAIKYYGDVVYMNSGDWVESLSALTESADGSWNLVYFNEEITIIDEADDDDDISEPLDVLDPNLTLLGINSLNKKISYPDI